MVYEYLKERVDNSSVKLFGVVELLKWFQSGCVFYLKKNIKWTGQWVFGLGRCKVD